MRTDVPMGFWSPFLSRWSSMAPGDYHRTLASPQRSAHIRGFHWSFGTLYPSKLFCTRNCQRMYKHALQFRSIVAQLCSWNRYSTLGIEVLYDSNNTVLNRDSADNHMEITGVPGSRNLLSSSWFGPAHYRYSLFWLACAVRRIVSAELTSVKPCLHSRVAGHTVSHKHVSSFLVRARVCHFLSDRSSHP